jgi:hypothetical protein
VCRRIPPLKTALLAWCRPLGTTVEAAVQTLGHRLASIFQPADKNAHVFSVGRVLNVSKTMFGHTANGLPRFSGSPLVRVACSIEIVFSLDNWGFPGVIRFLSFCVACRQAMLFEVPNLCSPQTLSMILLPPPLALILDPLDTGRPRSRWKGWNIPWHPCCSGCWGPRKFSRLYLH